MNRRENLEVWKGVTAEVEAKTFELSGGERVCFLTHLATGKGEGKSKHICGQVKRDVIFGPGL